MMFAIVIVIITGKSHARTWSWLQDDASQFYLVPFSNPNGGKYSVAQGLRCSIALFWSFLSDRRFPHCRQQSSPMIILWEKLWQCDRIKEHGFWIVFVGQIAVLFFKFSTIFFFKCIKIATEITFPTIRNILNFLFLLCQI